MKLNIASWNIFGGKDVPGVLALLKEVDADIIGLQEVLQEADGSDNQAQRIADALGYDFVYEPTITLDPSISFLLKELKIERPMGWGNAILSRYPILEKKVHVLSDDRVRIALEATVEVAGESLHIFSTHLAHGGEAAAPVRGIQVRNLLAAASGKRSIVMGDFNTTPESAAIKEMEGAMQNTDTDPERFTIGAHPELYHGPNGESDRLMLDYIFVSDGIAPVSSRAIDSTASDHLPITATVELL